MNIRDLEYLVALEKHRHFRKAAEAVYVSQPTLSGQLKKLERYLGVQLVERGRRQQVLFTPVGEQIVQRARQLLSVASEIEQLAKLQQDPMRGELKMSLIPTLAPYLLPYILPVIKSHYPSLELLLYEHQTARLLKQLENGEIELGVLALPIHHDQLISLPLFSEPFYLVVPVEHPLAGRPFVTDADLKNETLLLLDDGHCFRDQALEICYTAGAREKHNFRGTSLETLRQMTLAGSGVTLLPELAIRQDSQVVNIPFQAPQPAREVGLIFRKGSPRQQTFEQLASLLRDGISAGRTPFKMLGHPAQE